jgi:hypothetical protein
MGFPKQRAIEAYYGCDKNFESAINRLLGMSETDMGENLDPPLTPSIQPLTLAMTPGPAPQESTRGMSSVQILVSNGELHPSYKRIKMS